jgi:hypothetical protein
MLAEKLAGKRTVTPQQAAQILEPLLKPVIRDFTDYTKDPNELEKIRQRVFAIWAKWSERDSGETVHNLKLSKVGKNEPS